MDKARTFLKRDQVWQGPRIRKEHAQIRAELDALACREPGLAQAHAVRELQSLRRDRETLAQLKSFLFILEILRLEAESSFLPEAEVERLRKAGTSLLAAQGVRAGKSRVAFLHARLRAAVAGTLKGRSAFDVAWRAAPGDWLAQAQQLMRSGDIPGVFVVLDRAPEDAWETTHALTLLALRLCGDCLGALELQRETKAQGKVGPSFGRTLRWERVCCEAQLSGSLREVFRLALASHSEPVWLLEANLWASAVASRQWRLKRPSLRSLEQRERRGDLSASEAESLRCVLKFNQCLDSAQPLSERVEKLGTLLDQAHRLPTISLEMLLWAAATRWLRRMRQSELAERTSARYRALSLSLSCGQSEDVWGLLHDLGTAKEAPLQQLPLDWLNRSARFSSLTWQLVKTLGWRRFKDLFSRPGSRRRLSEEEVSGLTEIAAKQLGDLKGPLIKMGQTASFLGLELPPAARGILNTLQDRSRPLSSEVIRSTLEFELGNPLSRLFSEFIDEPCGVGSIGQVHRARLKSGEWVAVKVRYPGIMQAVENDIRTLRLILPLGKLLLSRRLSRALIEELAVRLREECDYLHEAKYQSLFRERFLNHPGIYIPRVYPELSSRGVLTTEYVPSLSFEEFSQKSTEEERARMGEWICEFVVAGCRDGIFNTDTHPGNFRMTASHLVCLDFGSIKEWTPDQSAPWADLVLSGVLQEPDRFRKAVQGVGLVGDRHRFDFSKAFENYVQGPMGITARAGAVAFNHQRLHLEFRNLFTSQNPNLAQMDFNPAYLFGFRVYFGLIAVLSELGARCEFHRQIKSLFSVSGTGYLRSSCRCAASN